MLSPSPVLSEKSIYFDAPIANFHSTHDTDQAPTTTAPPKPTVMATTVNEQEQPISAQDASVNRQPTVAGAGSPRPIDLRKDGVTSPSVQSESPSMEGTDRPAIEHRESSGWLPATDRAPGEEVTPSNSGNSNGSHHRGTSILKKNNSLSRRSMGRAQSIQSAHSRRATSPTAYAESVGRRSTFTNSEGRPVAGSTFINGAGTTGPNAAAEPDESIHQRKASAEGQLTPKQKSKIQKGEAKDGKRLTKIIKAEGKIEKQALNVALQELAELQKFQKTAVKRESNAHTAHTKALTAFQKAEAEFMAARTRLETAQATVNAEAETLDVTRSNARQATENLQEKAQEVDGLRTMLGVDERERQVKVVELKGKPAKSSFWSRR